MNQERYRADIDGLRAIAVLSVLLFHVDAPLFKGGYVGVDVFFVISGFLITRLIFDEVTRREQFSFLDFYLRRARRLMPVFFFTLTLCFIVAFFLYPPPQMEEFGGSLFYSIVSLANFYFWQQSGYFDTTAVYKPLLHIWSLGVEEQFYLIWPMFLVFLLIKTPRHVLIVLIITFFISFYLNFVFVDGQVYLFSNYLNKVSNWFSDGRASIFYLMPFRVFEFCIGALLVWMVKYQVKNKWLLEMLFLSGLGMILFAVFRYTESTLFPSYNALLPCLGAALLIYAGEARHLGGILRFPLMVEIGKISYSLYLVHWPAIVFYKYYIYDFGVLSFLEQLSICLLSVFVAKLMYDYIEQPFRKGIGNKKMIPTRAFLITNGSLGIVLVFFAFAIWNQNGWDWRAPNKFTREDITIEITRSTSLSNIGCNIFDLDAPVCRPDAKMQVLFLGDSHSYVGYNMFTDPYLGQEDVNLIFFSIVNDCDFVIRGRNIIALGFGWNNEGRCQERAATISDPGFGERLDVLVISSQYMFKMGSELPIIEYLRSRNKDLKIVLIGPYIDIRPYQCADIINRFGNSAFCKDERFVSYFGGDVENDIYYNDYMKYDPIYVNTVKLLCEEGRLENCITEVDGVPMFYDGDHPSLEFSLLMGSRMHEEYSAELQKIGFAIWEK
jgi:peptidoglycan/LPS O-acetylase OafA/YrhL